MVDAISIKLYIVCTPSEGIKVHPEVREGRSWTNKNGDVHTDGCMIGCTYIQSSGGDKKLHKSCLHVKCMGKHVL